jgi:hypothetical protein
LTEIAESLSRRAEGRAGWDVPALPENLVLVHEAAWTGSHGSRIVRWPSVEMHIGLGTPELFERAWTFETVRVGDVNGALAVTYEYGGGSSVVWSPQPDVTVLIGFYGPLEQLLAIARSVEVVDESTWTTLTKPDTSTNDGCNSMFC